MSLFLVLLLVAVSWNVSGEEWVLESLCSTNRSSASLRRNLIDHGFQISGDAPVFTLEVVC